MGALEASNRAEGVYKKSLERFSKMAEEMTKELGVIPKNERLMVELTEQCKQQIERSVKLVIPFARENKLLWMNL